MDKVCVDFITNVKSGRKRDEVLNKHLSLQSGEERIMFILNTMSENSIIPQIQTDPKNADQSEKFRQDANSLFVSLKPPLTESNCMEILKLYTKSIAYAPCQSPELALAYANRSAILIKLHKYESCTRDIDRALALRCSDGIRAKLYVRKLECLNALRHPKVKDSMKEALYSLERLSLDRTYKNKLIEKLNSMKVAKNEKKRDKRRDDANQSVLPKINKRNTEAPCASDAIRIAYNEKYGRHLVATRKIKSGELLIREEPYVTILALEKIYSNCSNCFDVSWANIPCDYCTSTVYCSEDCKIASWKMCHDIECGIIRFLSNSFLIEDNLCSVRIVIQALREFGSMEELRKEVNEVDNCEDPRTKGFSKDGVLTGDKYRNVLGLIGNTEKRRREKQFMLSLHACYTLFFLATRTNLFGNLLDGDLLALANNNDVVFIGSLLLRHLYLLDINSHVILEENEQGGSIKCGYGILPFSSLINHSCKPNVVLKHKSIKGPPLRHVIYHYAKDPIKKDEQLFDCYIACYTFFPKAQRQMLLLQQYQFVCDCQSCQEE